MGGVMWLQSTFVPFYLREMLAGTRPVCPAFESITPPNRLTINAHTADYISDGCLGGKHCDGSANTRGTVTDTRLRSVPSLTHAGGRPPRIHGCVLPQRLDARFPVVT